MSGDNPDKPKKRRHSGGPVEHPSTSTVRRRSLTQGLKDGGRTVATAVENLFKDNRGELYDPEDNPEYVKIRPPWEEDLKKYLPDDESYPPWKQNTSSVTPSYASEHTSAAEENIASSSSRPPMVPELVSDNAAMNLLVGIKKTPQSLAAYRWHTAYQFVKRQNALMKKSLTSPIGTGATMHGRSLGVVPLSDETRRMVFDILYQENTEYFLLTVILLHLFVLILKAESKFFTPFRPSMSSLNGADIFLTLLYTFEMCSRIYCLGFCMGRHTYCRSAYNKLDLVIVVDSWVHIGRTIGLGRDAFFRIAVLRVFRCLLSLRQFSFIANVLAIMDAISKSVYSLRTVLVFTIMILSFYSLVGVQFFAGILQNRCLLVETNEVAYPPRFCTFDQKAIYGHLCPVDQGQVCGYVGNPNWEITSFDNYAAGMLILFQMLTFEGWSLIMYSVADVNGYSEAYFFIFVVFGSYFIVNIYIAAISSVFLRVRHEHQILLKRYRKDKAFSFANAIHMAKLLKDVILQDDAKLNWKQRLRKKTWKGVDKLKTTLSRQGTRLKRTMTKAVDWNDPNSYLKRISSFGLTGIDAIDMEQSGESSAPPRFGRSLSRNLSVGTYHAARFGRSVSMNTFLAAQTLSQKAHIIVESKLFQYAVLLLISLNMAGLCTITANMGDLHIHRLNMMETGLLIVFAFEMALRFVAAGFAGFVDERMNIVDVVVIFVSFGSLGFPNKTYPNFTPMRMLRWFYKKASHRDDLEEDSSIVVAIIRSFGPLGSVFFFLLIVIFVFAIIGMELWGGQFHFQEGYPRANFDTIFQAMLTWFSVTTAESWPNQMWNTMRPGVTYQWMGPICFILYYIISANVILNLIMAVILEQTELTDNQKKHIQKRDHIRWLQTKHTHHVSTTRGSDWLVGAVKGAQKGYKGMKQRMSTMRVSRMSLFPVLQPETGFVRMMPLPQPEQPPPDILPKSTSRAFLSSASDSPLPARRHSSVSIPGATAESRGETKTKGRIFRRSSLSALSTVGLLPQGVSGSKLRRRPSHDGDKVVLRSGFGKLLKADDGDNRTALQSALLTVVKDQKMVADKVEEDRRKAVSAQVDASPVQHRPDPRVPKPTFGKMPSRREKGPRLSFSMAEYEGIQSAGEKRAPWWLSDDSLFIFSPDNRIRRFCVWLAGNWWYQQWNVLYIITSVCLTMEQTVLQVYFVYMFSPFFPTLDWMVLINFCIDFIIQIIAYGFLLTPEPYLGDPYNFIDLFNLIVHILKVCPDPWGTGIWVNTFLILAAARPTRFIVRFQGLRSLTTALLKTIPAISQVFVFTIIVYAIFAVIGMQMFANRFRSCNDPTATGHLDCVGNYVNSVGILAPRTWVNPPFHFDAFGEAMLSLFVGSTFDSWLDYFLYPAMDVNPIQEMQPQRNVSPQNALFFVSFVCIGGFFILRMFIGVFIDQFGIISGSKLLTERQKLWRDTNRVIQAMQATRLPKHVPGRLRSVCYRVVHSRKFELLIIVVILINYGYIASQHYGQGPSAWTFDSVEAMFVSLYLLEFLLKFLGTQFEDWFHHKWNLLEFVLVMINVACLFPEREVDSMRKTVGTFVYILRIFRIIRYIPLLSTMVNTVLISLPGMVDIISLMGIFLYLMAGIGLNVFNNIRDGSCYADNMSFQAFTTSFVLLFQITTLDNWSCLLTDITINQPSCVKGLDKFEDDCGFPVGGIVYMMVVVIVSGHIFGNLFVAQIIDCITFGLLDENAMITPSHLNQYQLLWAQKEFDHHCTGYLGIHKLKSFVTRLGPPLGSRLTFYDKWITRIEYEALHFRGPKGMPFRALLETLVLYKIGPRGLELPIRIERERQLQSVYREGAAIKIQALARGYLQRKGWTSKKAKEEKEEITSGGRDSPREPPEKEKGKDNV